MVGREDQTQSAVSHQGDFITGNGFCGLEFLSVVVIRNYHAGGNGGIGPPLFCKPVLVHVHKGSLIWFGLEKDKGSCINRRMVLHPLDGLAVRRKLRRRQQHFGKFSAGDGLLRAEGVVRVAVDPAPVDGLLDLLLCPVALNVREPRRRGGSGRKEGTAQQRGQEDGEETGSFHGETLPFSDHILYHLYYNITTEFAMYFFEYDKN